MREQMNDTKDLMTGNNSKFEDKGGTAPVRADLPKNLQKVGSAFRS